MSEFDKAKIAFALALLATVFTVHPIVAPELGRTFDVAGVSLALRWFYLGFIALLVLSVYCFSWDMLSGRPVSRLRDAGTLLYAGALVLPLFTGGLAAVGWIAGKILPFAERIADASSLIFSVAAALVAIRKVFEVRTLIVKLDTEVREARAVAAEASHLNRAEEMLKLGHHDLAAIEAWRAIEVAVSTALFRRTPAVPVAVQPKAQLDQAIKLGVVPEAYAESAHWLRQLRNKAAHGGGSIPHDDAEQAIRKAVSILGAIARPELDADAA